VPRQNAIAEPGREALDLRLDSFGDVDLAIERNVRVSPERVLPARRACFVKETLLRHEHERALGKFSVGRVALGRSGLGKVAAEMNCAGASARFGFPRNWRAQRVIDFKNAGRVSKIFQAPSITNRQSLGRDSRELPG